MSELAPSGARKRRVPAPDPSRGYGLMADVVIALAARPMTAREVSIEFAGRVGMGPLRRLLRRLLDGRVLRICDWSGRQNPSRVYSLGSEPSVPAPTKPRMNGTTPSPPRIPQTPAIPMVFIDKFCTIWDCLETACTIAEICEETGSVPGVIRPLLNRLRKATPKLVRIVGYESDIQRAVIYERGSKPDAKRPPIMSEHESYMRAKGRRLLAEQRQALSFFPLAA